MKAVEFAAIMAADQTLKVPAAVACSLPADQPVRVLVLVEEDSDREWQVAATRDFGLGYADGDAIYDQLSAG